jgi:hypothetical protein
MRLLRRESRMAILADRGKGMGLVARAKYLTWTEDNLLCQVIYDGLCEDKLAAGVRRAPPPAADRHLWQAALVPGDLLEDGGTRARHSDYSNRDAVYGYGRWLTWLERQGLLEVESSPTDRIIPARVAAYITDLEKHNATQTLLNRLQELAAVAAVMDPNRDWSWIYRMHSQVRARHRPARPKRHRLVPVQELFDLGLGLMTGAERENSAGARAAAYRDGLIIALLAARPLRLRNLAGLALDRTLVSRGSQWWIEFPASDTKTKEPIELPWPEILVAPLETYLARHRGVLAQLRGGSTLSIGGALWRYGRIENWRFPRRCRRARRRQSSTCSTSG